MQVARLAKGFLGCWGWCGRWAGRIPKNGGWVLRYATHTISDTHYTHWLPSCMPTILYVHTKTVAEARMSCTTPCNEQGPILTE
ncbi:hypothetical protein F4808DRAFT_422571 [Astrocystis sublimbata]|nr:hypothetical protein F4808DRAFT_422571 [Astrocystis sublimbata]